MTDPSAGRFARKRVAPGIFRRGDMYEALVSFHGKLFSAGSHPTIDAARKARARRLVELEDRHLKGYLFADAKTKFAVWAEVWWADRVQHLKPSTRRSHRSILDRHLIPKLGDKRLCDCTEKLLKETSKAFSVGRKEKTQKNILQVLKTILHAAVMEKLILADPTPAIQFPAIRKRNVQAIPPETVQRVIERMPYPLREAAYVAFLSGMRMGEVLGLKWSDIDFAGMTINVERARDASGEQVSPKSDAGIRTIPLPKEAIAFLRSYQEQQEARRTFHLQKARLVLDQVGRRDRRPGVRRKIQGNSQRMKQAEKVLHWCKLEAEGGYLFPSPPHSAESRLKQRLRLAEKRAKRLGRPAPTREDLPPLVERLPVIESRKLQRAFQLAARAEAIRMRFHDLRHTFASVLLHYSGEAALAQLAASLGHSSASFTLAQYSHIIAGRSHVHVAPMGEFAPSPALSTGLGKGGSKAMSPCPKKKVRL